MSVLDNVAGLVSNVAGSLLFSPAVLVSRGAAARDGRGGFTYIDVITEIKALIVENDIGHEGGTVTTASDRVAIMVPLHGVPTEIKTGAYIALNNIVYNVTSIDSDAADAVATCVCDRAGISIGQGLDIEIILGASGNVDGSANARLVQVLQNIVANSDLARGAANATAAIALDSIIIAAVGTVAVPAELHAGAIATLEDVGQVETVQVRVRSDAIAVNTLQNVNQAIFGSLQDSAFGALTQTLSPIAATTAVKVDVNASAASQLGQVTSATDTDVSNASYVAALLTPLGFTANAGLEGELSITATLEVVTSTAEATAEATSDNFNILGSIGIAASATAPVAGSVSQTLQAAIGVNDLDLITAGAAGITLGDITITATATVEPAPGGLEAETIAYIDAMSVEPDEDRQAIINDLFVDLKAAGVLSKMSILYLLRAHDIDASQINAANPGVNDNTVALSVWTEDEGVFRTSAANTTVAYRDMFDTTPNRFAIGVMIGPNNTGNGDFVGIGSSREIRRNNANGIYSRAAGPELISGIDTPGVTTAITEALSGVADTALIIDDATVVTTGSASLVPGNDNLFRFGDGGQQYAVWACETLTEVEVYALHAALHRYNNAIDHMRGTSPQAADYFNRVAAKTTPFTDDRKATLNTFFDTLNAAGLADRGNAWYAPQHDDLSSQENWFRDQAHAVPVTAGATVDYDTAFVSTATSGDDWQFLDPQIHADQDYWCLGFQLDEPWRNWQTVMARGWDERYGTQQYDGGSNIFEMRLSNGYIQTTPPQYANCCMTRNSSYEEAFVNGVTAGTRTGVAAPSSDTNQGFIKAPNNSSSAHRRFACVYSFDHITEAEALIIHNAWEQYKLDKANEGSGSLAYQVIQTAQAVGDPALLLLPSAPTAGNLLIAVSGHRETEASSNFTGSSGWTEILTEHAYPTNSIHRRAMALYYKISDGTETSFHSFDFGGAGNLAGLVELSVTPDVDGLHGYQYDPGTTSLESSQSTGVLTGLPQGNYLLIAAVYARDLMGAGTTLDNGFDNLDAYFETAPAPAQSLGLSFQPVNTSGSVETTVSYAADVRGLAAIAALPL